MFNRTKRQPQNGIVRAEHPAVAGALAASAEAFADAVEPVVHSTLDHWVSLSALFVVACVLFYLSATGQLPS